MADTYEIKIRNHQKLDRDDIKDFCLDQAKRLDLSDYVTDFIIEKIIWGTAGYNDELSLVCLDTEFMKQYDEYKKFYRLKNILDRILLRDADFFNLFIIEAIFHELWHAKQKKKLRDTPDSCYSILIKSSDLFKPKSGSTYKYYHDRYYFEYDAIINSILLTLSYAKCFGFDKKAMILLNRSWAINILNAYGIDIQENTHSKYASPIEFFKYFFDKRFPIYDRDRPILDELETSISDYVPNGDINSLLRGYPISDSIKNKLTEIASGKVDTIDIFTELSLCIEQDAQNEKKVS